MSITASRKSLGLEKMCLVQKPKKKLILLHSAIAIFYKPFAVISSVKNLAFSIINNIRTKNIHFFLPKIV